MENNYQRLFYILKNMDSDVGYPTGYIKVEINCEVAKIQTSLTNLLNRQGLVYELYGIKKDDKNLAYTFICEIPNTNGRADVKITEDIHSVGSQALNLEDINVFAIITQSSNQIYSIKCPLVAYKKEEFAWKKEFEGLLLSKDVKNISTQDVMDTFKEKSEPEQLPDKQIALVQLPEELAEEALIEATSDITEELGHKQNSETVDSEDAVHVKSEQSEDTLCVELKDLDGNLGVESESSEDTVCIKIEDAGDNQNSAVEVLEQQEPQEPQEPSFDIAEKFEVDFANNDILGSAKKNFKDISSIDIEGNKIKNELNMPNLKEELDKSFESYNPFKMKNKSFKWWKINSPGFLNNILFRNNIKTYMLFNPKVMLAHYKYRYIIFGIRNDKHSGKEYCVCGVPGVYSIDENPFGSTGSWAQLEGYKPKYGAFGYWVILIDPRTGKLVKIK